MWKNQVYSCSRKILISNDCSLTRCWNKVRAHSVSFFYLRTSEIPNPNQVRFNLKEVRKLSLMDPAAFDANKKRQCSKLVFQNTYSGKFVVVTSAHLWNLENTREKRPSYTPNSTHELVTVMRRVIKLSKV